VRARLEIRGQAAGEVKGRERLLRATIRGELVVASDHCSTTLYAAGRGLSGIPTMMGTCVPSLADETAQQGECALRPCR
jgi:hypothetical protein